ncbi:hypothetical protein ACQ4PT_011138 [Festuca glaucescens]
MVCRAFGSNRLPGCTHFTSNVGVFALVLGDETAKRLQPVKDLDGHATFVGNACCDAYPAGTSSSLVRWRHDQREPDLLRGR